MCDVIYGWPIKLIFLQITLNASYYSKCLRPQPRFILGTMVANDLVTFSSIVFCGRSTKKLDNFTSVNNWLYQYKCLALWTSDHKKWMMTSTSGGQHPRHGSRHISGRLWMLALRREVLPVTGKKLNSIPVIQISKVPFTSCKIYRLMLSFG